MTLTYSIDQAFALKFGLNLSEASVYAAMRDLPAWADSAVIDGETYYFASRNKMCAELPLITTKADTMYRHYKALEKAQVVKLTKVGDKDYVHLCKGPARLWNRAKPTASDGLPTDGNKSDGKKSDKSDLPASSLSEPPYNPPKGEPQKPDQKKSKSAQDREKAEKGLAFFNKITDRDLSSKEHIKAFERAIKRGATGEDIAHATYEQIISTWGDKEAIRKWLTPLTICRSANLTRLCDAWRFRSEAERSKLIRQIHGVGPRTSGYNPTGGASNEGYNLRKLIEKQNAPRYD